MKKRLIIYFHYDSRGQVDSACRFAVSALTEQAELFFVTNGTLQPGSRIWVQGHCARLLERQNTGFDVGAYRQALLNLGRAGLDGYDEVILMNYTLAGPISPLQQMFSAMDARPELDFWGLTRHYAMKSRRFGGTTGRVPEHLQSHFLAVRPGMYDDFFAYWRTVRLPQSYEQSVALHETRFTAHFARLGYRWDSYVDTRDLAESFVNPMMACPRELVAERGCPFFKRRSFFTPYGDELRRTDGQAAGELYRYLSAETEYPVDRLIAEMLPVQPLTSMTQNLHWHYLLGEPEGELPLELTEPRLRRGAELNPENYYWIRIPARTSGAEGWYRNAAQPYPEHLRAAARLLETHPLLGLIGPSLPLAPLCAEGKFRQWEKDLPGLQRKMAEQGITVPLDTAQPLPLPNGGFLVLRGAAFPQTLPPVEDFCDLWLLPLLAQQRGYASATVETQEQALARTDVLDAMLAGNRSVGAKARDLGRAVKHSLKDAFDQNKKGGGTP